MPSLPLYPASASARDRFVAERRGARPSHDPWQYQGLIVEDERTGEGVRARTATVLLTGRECPWRCAMCDLWRYTTVADTPSGAIAAQVAAAVAALHEEQPRVSVLKLYNAGSFFDPRAVPVEDYDAIAATLAGFSRVVVESHPALIGPRVDRLLDALSRHGVTPGRPAALEVAMGLETAHPAALDRLNKRFTLTSVRARGASTVAPRRRAACVPADLPAVRGLRRTGRLASALGGRGIRLRRFRDSARTDPAGERSDGSAGRGRTVSRAGPG